MPKDNQRPGTGIVRLERDANSLSGLVVDRGDILPTLPNMRDNYVVQKLATAKIGDLPVDRFAHLLSEEGRSPVGDHVIALRVALIRIYFAAANARQYAVATREQLKSAQAALISLAKAIKQVEQVQPSRLHGLRGAFGSPMDDQKGVDELNDFGSRCSQLRMDIVPIMMGLRSAIETEQAKPKPAKAGERKKRLRTLVEGLADWWKAVTGKSFAPYVQAKRLDGGGALVIGRSGQPVEIALALFSKVDEFTGSEVISAVTNVYESGLPKKK